MRVQCTQLRLLDPARGDAVLDSKRQRREQLRAWRMRPLPLRMAIPGSEQILFKPHLLPATPLILGRTAKGGPLWGPETPSERSSAWVRAF